MCSGADKPLNGRGDDGFTLMETIVALVIFVACYLVIHEGLSLGWRGVQLAQSETVALQVAQSRLASAGLDEPLAEGQSSGQAGSYAWTMDVRRRDAGQGAAPSSLQAFWVTVAVSWHDRARLRSRSLQLTTLKLAVQP